MVKDEIAIEPNGPEGRHDRWLAMQSAYSEYMQASDAFDHTYETADGLGASDRLRMMILEGRHRTAFERYMEARMAFLESEFDDIRGPDDYIPERGFTQTLPVSRGENRSDWRSFANCRVLLESLAIILLCTTAFSLVRAQKHMRDLETAHQELETALKQNSNGLQALGQKVDKLTTMQVAATERVKYAAATNEPLRRAPSRRVSLNNSADWQRKHFATQHTPREQYLKSYPSSGAETRRPKVSKPDSALPLARQTPRGAPRGPWWATLGAPNPVDSRF